MGIRELSDERLIEVVPDWRKYAEFYREGVSGAGCARGILDDMNNFLIELGYLSSGGKGWVVTDRSGRELDLFMGGRDLMRFTRKKDVVALTSALGSGSYGYLERD